MKNVLCFQYYDSGNPNRQEELNYVLQENLKLQFDDYFIFIHPDLDFPSDDQRITYISLQDRLKFSNFLEIVTCTDNQLLVLINSDIQLNESLFSSTSYLQIGMMFALTRYEKNGELAYSDNPRISQDTWIMKSQPLPQTLIDQSQIQLGIPGCENLFSGSMKSYGFEVFNPCLDIQTYHHHDSDYRTTASSERYWGLYYEPEPCFLKDISEGRPILKSTMRVLSASQGFIDVSLTPQSKSFLGAG
ncbi:hypothetical protein VZG28_12760 [Synechococcus elongatus IITB4]|uniref:hypothetical protein n=1 Tax=Synechococcus elongatus TaxID=32046 RepID=UPI0030CC9DC2